MAPFKTTNLPFAAFLRINGYVMTGIENTGGKGTFLFEEVPLSVKMDFDNGNTTVEPNAFHDMVRRIKSMVVNREL